MLPPYPPMWRVTWLHDKRAKRGRGRSEVCNAVCMDKTWARTDPDPLVSVWYQSLDWYCWYLDALRDRKETIDAFCTNLGTVDSKEADFGIRWMLRPIESTSFNRASTWMSWISEIKPKLSSGSVRWLSLTSEPVHLVKAKQTNKIKKWLALVQNWNTGLLLWL